MKHSVDAPQLSLRPLQGDGSSQYFFQLACHYLRGFRAKCLANAWMSIGRDHEDRGERKRRDVFSFREWLCTYTEYVLLEVYD